MLKNFFSYSDESLPEELIEQIESGQSFRLERIISDGQASPADFWYDQPDNEWVLLLKGRATIELEYAENSTSPGQALPDSKPAKPDSASPIMRIDLLPGDYVLIPAHCRHRVASTCQQQKTVWLALHFQAADEVPAI